MRAQAPSPIPCPGRDTWPVLTVHSADWTGLPSASLLGWGAAFFSGARWRGKGEQSRQAPQPQGWDSGQGNTRGWVFSLGEENTLGILPGRSFKIREPDPDQGVAQVLPLRLPQRSGPTAGDITAPYFLADQTSQSFPGPDQLLKARRGRPQPRREE